VKTCLHCNDWFTPTNEREVFCSKGCAADAKPFVWLGEMRLIDYPLVIVSASREVIERQMVAEWVKKYERDGSDAPFTPETVTFEQLTDWLEISVRAITMDVITWP
jgi:hypothetical protein